MDKFNKALGYIWDTTGGDDIEYGYILVKHLGYTKEELENELAVNCGLYDEEGAEIVEKIYKLVAER